MKCMLSIEHIPFVLHLDFWHKPDVDSIPFESHSILLTGIGELSVKV